MAEEQKSPIFKSSEGAVDRSKLDESIKSLDAESIKEQSALVRSADQAFKEATIYYNQKFDEAVKKIDPAYSKDKIEYILAEQSRSSDYRFIKKTIDAGEAIDGAKDIDPRAEAVAKRLTDNAQAIRTGTIASILSHISTKDIEDLDAFETVKKDFDEKVGDKPGISFEELFDKFKEIAGMYEEALKDAASLKIFQTPENSSVISAISKILKDSGLENESVSASAEQYEKNIKRLVGEDSQGKIESVSTVDKEEKPKEETATSKPVTEEAKLSTIEEVKKPTIEEKPTSVQESQARVESPSEPVKTESATPASPQASASTQIKTEVPSISQEPAPAKTEGAAPSSVGKIESAVAASTQPEIQSAAEAKSVTTEGQLGSKEAAPGASAVTAGGEATKKENTAEGTKAETTKESVKSNTGTTNTFASDFFASIFGIGTAKTAKGEGKIEGAKTELSTEEGLKKEASSATQTPDSIAAAEGKKEASAEKAIEKSGITEAGSITTQEITSGKKEEKTGSLEKEETSKKEETQSELKTSLDKVAEKNLAEGEKKEESPKPADSEKGLNLTPLSLEGAQGISDKVSVKIPEIGEKMGAGNKEAASFLSSIFGIASPSVGKKDQTEKASQEEKAQTPSESKPIEAASSPIESEPSSAPSAPSTPSTPLSIPSIVASAEPKPAETSVSQPIEAAASSTKIQEATEEKSPVVVTQTPSINPPTNVGEKGAVGAVGAVEEKGALEEKTAVEKGGIKTTLPSIEAVTPVQGPKVIQTQEPLSRKERREERRADRAEAREGKTRLSEIEGSNKTIAENIAKKIEESKLETSKASPAPQVESAKSLENSPSKINTLTPISLSTPLGKISGGAETSKISTGIKETTRQNLSSVLPGTKSSEKVSSEPSSSPQNTSTSSGSTTSPSEGVTQKSGESSSGSSKKEEGAPSKGYSGQEGEVSSTDDLNKNIQLMVTLLSQLNDTLQGPLLVTPTTKKFE